MRNLKLRRILNIIILLISLVITAGLIDEIGATETAFMFITYFIVMNIWRRVAAFINNY